MMSPTPIWLIGDPVEHSLSPVFQNAGLSALGLPYVYQKRHTRKEDLRPAVAAIRRGDVLGANVTLPYKEDVGKLVDRLSPAAVRAGAVNTIVRVCGGLEGDNTDVAGLRRAFVERGLDSEPVGVVAVLGAGGAARAAVVSLDQLGARHIFIVNRSRARAQRLVETMKGATCGVLEAVSLDENDQRPVNWGEVEFIVHTTSLGLGSERDSEARATAVWERLPWGTMERLRMVHDVCYSRTETPFLSVARGHGFAGEDGLSMLLYQGVISFSMWTAARPPLEDMRAALWAAAGR